MRHSNLLISTLALAFTILALLACSSTREPENPMDAMRSLLPGKSSLSGLALKDSAIAYERNTVWDYLGQSSEVFLNNGLDKVALGNYVSSDNSRAIAIELVLYREPVNAFTMYSLYRNPAGRFVEVPTEGHLIADTLRFIKGSYVGRIVRSGEIPDDNLIRAAKMISDKITDTTNAFPPQLALFPAEGRIPHSETLHLRDQARHDELPEFYGCKYIVEGDTMTLYFLLNSRVGLPTATETFIGQKGNIDNWLMDGTNQSMVGKHPDFGAVFCSIDKGTLAVITGFSDRKNAQALAERFLQNLSK
ncbi:MAG: DUF6599 family protein [Candidatus Zixiibacteriota bacterium]